MSTAVDTTSDMSISTEIPKIDAVVSPSDPSAIVEPVQESIEARNDAPTTDDRIDETKEKDDVAITINGTTIVLLPEETLVTMSKWVDDANEYWEIKEVDNDDNAKKSARERLAGSLVVMGNGVKNKTVKISHDMAEWIVSVWKKSDGQSTTDDREEAPATTANTGTEHSKSLKVKFNEFLESLKFAIDERKEGSVVNCGAFNDDDDSAMMAHADIEVMLAETESAENRHEC
jgi:hypothetical protein